MNHTASKNHFLGAADMPKLLIRMSIPSIVASLVNGLYGVTDAIFVGQWVGKYAIGALSVVYGFDMFRIALGSMIGVGAASIVSRSLGAGDIERANRCAGAAFAVAAVSGAVVTALAWAFADPLLLLFGATPGIIGSAKEYLLVLVANTVVFLPALCGFNLMRSEGRPDLAMKPMFIGAALNIGLDVILIVWLRMGVEGAAMATVIAQCATFLLVVRFYISERSALGIRRRHLTPHGTLMKRVLALGAPTFARIAGGGLMMIAVNHSLRMYAGDGADLGISVYGVIGRIMLFVLLPMFGVIQGFQPVVGYNFGVGGFDRVKKAMKLTFAALTLYAVGILLGFAAAPGHIVRLFNDDPALVEIASGALVLTFLGFPVISVSMIGSAFFQAIGKALLSLTLLLTRQIVFLIPLIFGLPRYYGVDGIWAAIPISGFLSAALAMILLAREMRNPPWSAAGESGAKRRTPGEALSPEIVKRK